MALTGWSSGLHTPIAYCGAKLPEKIGLEGSLAAGKRLCFNAPVSFRPSSWATRSLLVDLVLPRRTRGLLAGGLLAGGILAGSTLPGCAGPSKVEVADSDTN